LRRARGRRRLATLTAIVASQRSPIDRRDFPTVRRGYDPSAVDAYLEAVAARVADLERRLQDATPVSARAGEQVRAIVEAAERGARDIRAAAEADARERTAKVVEATDRLGARIDGLAADVGALSAEARRLREQLAALEPDALEPPSPAPVVDPEVPAPPSSRLDAASVAPPSGVPRAAVDASAPVAGGNGADAPTRSAAATPSRDAEAARIVALDMALSGTPREETERYLAEHYDLPDRAALLDDAYAAAETT
jgi:DivIVA domain-containing protein